MVFGQRHGSASGWLIVVVAIIASSSCRQIAGVTDLPAPNEETCGLQLDGACGACTQQNCCAEASACASLGSCRALELCLARCQGDVACRSKCTIDNRVQSHPVIPAAL